MSLSPSSYCYIPVIRSRAAELKGFAEFAGRSISGVLPAIELTRSRRSKKNPAGSVELSIERVKEILDGWPFIADLTSLDSQSNGQIEALLDPDNGFSNWVSFYKNQLGPQAVPVAHLTEPFDLAEFERQVKALLQDAAAVALRIPTSFQQAEEVLAAAARFVEGKPFFVLVDAGFLRQDVSAGVFQAASQMSLLASVHGASLIAPLASSFPSSVAIPGYGGDSEGEFRLVEVDLSETVKRTVQGPIIHGDYAAIHPLDFDGMVTAWVPRVDIPLDTSLYYRRRRRNAGGYVLAAQEALADPRFLPLSCWAEDNVRQAAAGDPQGRSPSHWIAVRLNYYVSRQIKRLATGLHAAPR